MTQDLITIGIPVYNMGKSILAAVASCIAQTYEHIEILIVDDGSTDDGIKLLENNISDPRIRIYRRPKNGGVCAAMRDLVDNARGEYICFLDADDTMMPTRVEKQYAAIQSARTRYPNRMVASFCGSEVNEVNRNRTYRINPYNLWNYGARHGFGGGTGHAMYRVADIKSVGNFDLRFSRSADGAMCITFLMNGGFLAMVPEPLITYNFVWDETKKSISKTETKLFMELRREVIAANPRNMYLRRFAGLAPDSGKTRIMLFGLVTIITVKRYVDENGTRRTWIRLFDIIPLIKLKR